MSSSISNGKPENREETARLQALAKRFAEVRALQFAEWQRNPPTGEEDAAKHAST